VKFVFADEKGVKQRPALIISTDRYHRGRVTVQGAVQIDPIGVPCEACRRRSGHATQAHESG
jgi:hypothetical protein